MRAAFADHLAQIGLCIVKFRHQTLVTCGFFDRIEVGALDILDNRHFKRIAVAGFDDNDRHFVQSGPLCGPPAAFTGDDFKHIGQACLLAHDNRLDNAFFTDRVGQFLEIDLGKGLAGIARIGAEKLGRNLAGSCPARIGLVRFATDITHKGSETTAQT